MRRVTRLETVADVQDHPDARTLSVSARHDAVLDDGSRLVLLDGRGWSEGIRGPGAGEIDDVWTVASAQHVMETARVVVGPDEPYGNRTRADMEAGHWATLAERLRAHGVAADAAELRRLPHEVVLSERLRARVGS